MLAAAAAAGYYVAAPGPAGHGGAGGRSACVGCSRDKRTHAYGLSSGTYTQLNVTQLETLSSIYTAAINKHRETKGKKLAAKQQFSSKKSHPAHNKYKHLPVLLTIQATFIRLYV
jgi:hypothetical protein